MVWLSPESEVCLYRRIGNPCAGSTGDLLTIGAAETPWLLPALGCSVGREHGACRAEQGLGVWRAGAAPSLSLVSLAVSHELLELSGVQQQHWVPG